MVQNGSSIDLQLTGSYSSSPNLITGSGSSSSLCVKHFKKLGTTTIL